LRLRDQTKYFATAAAERFWRHRCSCIDFGRASTRAQSRRNFSLKRSRRSCCVILCAQGRRRFDGEEADLWNLSRPSDSRLRVWGIDIQTEIRSSRRQPTGQRSAQRQSRDHRAEPWFRGRSGIVAEKSVTGEIVDMMCYIDHNAIGEEHGKSCGAKCIKNGGPVGIVENGKAYLVVGEHKPMNDQLAEYCGKMVTVKGKAADRGGIAM